MEDIEFKFNGLVWFFMGVVNMDSLFYYDEFNIYLKEYLDNFCYDIVLSWEQKNFCGGKLYVQDKMEEYSEELFDKLDKGVYIYFCGFRGMMLGI